MKYSLHRPLACFAALALFSSFASAQPSSPMPVRATAMSRTVNGAVMVYSPSAKPFEAAPWVHFNERADADGICRLLGFGGAAENGKVAESQSTDPTAVVDSTGAFSGYNLRRAFNTNSYVTGILCVEPSDWAQWASLPAPRLNRIPGIEHPVRRTEGPVFINGPRFNGGYDAIRISTNSDLNGVCLALGFNSASHHTVRHLGGFTAGYGWTCSENTTAIINAHGYFQHFDTGCGWHDTKAVLDTLTCQ